MRAKFFLAAFAAALWCAAPCVAQPDTALYLTPTSQKVAPWLKDLSNPTGTGHVSFCDWELGSSLLSMKSRRYVDSLGMDAYYANTSLLHNDLNMAGQNLRRDFGKMRQAGANMARSPSLISLGFVEPVSGTYHWEFIDSTVRIAGLCGVKLLGSVVPFADWAQTCNAANGQCPILTGGDFYFVNLQKTGPVCPADSAGFYEFARQTVERYDGDGVDDMPGLTQPITVWEFMSEPESPCGDYSASAYGRDLGLFRRAMKEACPSCRLVNGGWAGYLQDTSFWKTVIQDDHAAIDAGNVHCNDGRTALFNLTKVIAKQVNFFQGQIDRLSLDWNIWLTEWGIYCGQPQGLPLRTEEQEASLYAKTYCWCLANNVTDIFYDLRTPSDSFIRSSSLLQENPGPKDSLFARLFFYTQKLLEYKFRGCDSVKAVQMDTTADLPKGDIRFYKSGRASDVMWGLTALPSGLNGTKTVTDLYGNVRTVDLAGIVPMGADPVIVEDTIAQTTGAVEAAAMAAPLTKVSLRFHCGPRMILASNVALHGATLVIEDISGRTVRRMTNISGRTVVLPRTDLPQGIYLVRLIEGNTTVAAAKLVLLKNKL